MAKPPRPPPYPPSLIAEDICTLIGFGIKVDVSPPRYSHGANPAAWPSTGSSKIFNRQPTKRAFFELAPIGCARVRELFDGEIDDFDRRVYVAHESKQAITHIEEVHAADIPPGDSVIQPMNPMVCAIHLFETFDGAPLLILFDEQYDRAVLAIGNLGEKPIEFTPKSPRSYRPAWYRDLPVRNDLPVYVPALPA